MTASRVFLVGSTVLALLTFIGALAAGVALSDRIRGRDDDDGRWMVLLEEALDTFDAGDTAKSRSLTERVLAISPAEPIARANLGRIYKLEGDYPRAIAEHKLALASDPELPDLYYNIACYYALLKREDDALTWLALAIDHGFARMSTLREDPDLKVLSGDERFELLARTGRLATGTPRVHAHPSAHRVPTGGTFELSVVVQREVPERDAVTAAKALAVSWAPDEPLTLVSSTVETVATPGDGYVSLRTTGRFVVRAPEDGLFALPPARVEATVAGETVVVMSDAYALEVGRRSGEDADAPEEEGAP